MSHSLPQSRVRWLSARLLKGVTGAYAIVLVIGTHYPDPGRFVPIDATGDKPLHFLAYGLLASLAGASVATGGGWGFRRAVSLALGLAAFGILDEVTQPLFPPRTADARDWAFDCAGIAVGLLAVALTVTLVRRRTGPASLQIS